MTNRPGPRYSPVADPLTAIRQEAAAIRQEAAAIRQEADKLARPTLPTGSMSEDITFRVIAYGNLTVRSNGACVELATDRKPEWIATSARLDYGRLVSLWQPEVDRLIDALIAARTAKWGPRTPLPDASPSTPDVPLVCDRCQSNTNELTLARSKGATEIVCKGGCPSELPL